MIIFPNSKINLGLNIVGKRNDGYHNLETVFYPVQIKDAVEIIEGKDQSPIDDVSFSKSGIEIDGDPGNNLCVKAYHLLKKDFPQLPAVRIHLHKTIPLGAGLAGGSADGAFTLQLLNKKFQPGISNNQLFDYALQLGSDCPFFILNKPCFATGRGESLQEIKIDLSVYKILIVYPGIHISTAWAFSNLQPTVPQKSLKELIHQPVHSWKGVIKNDFEEPVFNQFPEIKEIKEKLYDAGAVYSSMSGSGSAVYGIFEREKTLSLSFPENYFFKELHCQF
jgi:4-diphosphocytidyl-2-C-methyl-D-erythritol kinase